VGRAEGELPWFGLIKLYISGETSQPSKQAPDTSVRMLILTIVLIIAIPIILDLLFTFLSKRLKARKEDSEAGPGPEPDSSTKLKPPSPSSYKPQRFNESKGPPDQKYPGTGKTLKYDRGLDRKDLPPGSEPQAISKEDLLKKIK
jgi:hypothetical protein